MLLSSPVSFADEILDVSTKKESEQPRISTFLLKGVDEVFAYFGHRQKKMIYRARMETLQLMCIDIDIASAGIQRVKCPDTCTCATYVVRCSRFVRWQKRRLRGKCSAQQLFRTCPYLPFTSIRMNDNAEGFM